MMNITRDMSSGPDLTGKLENPRLDALRTKINSEEYLHEAIQRIALILSNELLDIPQGGMGYERQRKRRR